MVTVQDRALIPPSPPPSPSSAATVAQASASAGGAVLDTDEWEALLVRADALFGRAMNRPGTDVAVGPAAELLGHLDSVIGAFRGDAQRHAQMIRHRYAGVLGGAAASEDTQGGDLSGGGGGDQSDGEDQSEEGSGSDSEAGGEPLRYDRSACGEGHLYVLHLRLSPGGGRSSKAHKFGTCKPQHAPSLRTPPIASRPASTCTNRSTAYRI